MAATLINVSGSMPETIKVVGALGGACKLP